MTEAPEALTSWLSDLPGWVGPACAIAIPAVAFLVMISLGRNKR